MCVPIDGTLREALVALDSGGVGIALVVDSDLKLQGAMTDGDIRRALLSGASLGDGVMGFYKKEVFTVEIGSSRAEAIDLMQAMRIDQIPVLDPGGHVHGVHLLHELLGAVERPNCAVIMAGGKGTRLGELTRTIPKPMLKVAGRPILERLILHFVGFGIRRIFLAVNHLYEVIEEYFEDGSRFGCQIEYLHEEEPLGTGGALSLLPTLPSCPLFVSNGDLVTQANLEDMLSFHEIGGYGMTVGVYDYTHQIPYGCVEQENGQIHSIVEKPTIVRAINAGIYVVNPPLLKMVPKKFFPITELINLSLLNTVKIGAWQVNDEWIDVGHREELKRARNG
ncbi:MAG: nucleotidyltransferase family protein [bacterium]